MKSKPLVMLWRTGNGVIELVNRHSKASECQIKTYFITDPKRQHRIDTFEIITQHVPAIGTSSNA